MTTFDFISYDELKDALELDTTDNYFAVAGDFLLDAVTDWPTFNLTEPKDLIATLKEEIKRPLTFDNLDAYQKNLKFETDNGWKKESVTALLELFDFERKNHYDRIIELETIIGKLTEHYGQKKNKSSC